MTASNMGGGVAVSQFLVHAICVRFIPLATLPLSDAKGSRDGSRDNRISVIFSASGYCQQPSPKRALAVEW
ncbi:MAG: hypothetical protein AAAC50_14590 [Rhizobium altiplani]